MENTTRKLLDETIERELKKLDSFDTGSDQKSKVIDDLTQLYKLRIEEEKIEAAQADGAREREARKQQLKSQSIDRWVNTALQVGLTVGGWIAYDIWYRRGLRFEQFGTITAPMTRNLCSKLFPKK